MCDRTERYRKRYIRKCIKRCTAIVTITLVACTSINLYMDYGLHKSLAQVQWQQEDTLNTIMYHRIYTEPELAPVNAITKIEEKQLVSLGEFTITHYCPCKTCCGKSPSDPAYRITKLGTEVQEGRTIGVDPEVISLGTTVYIDGQPYVAEDIGGGMNGKRIDMFVESHQVAKEKGVYEREVFIKL
ncbi:MAG: 3D domain-containing protein [Aminipila sp.]